MAKKFQLSIPEPCHENWDAMTPVEQGKFCGSCQKQVVDFSNMSDRQMAEFFKKPSTGSVCGRFMTDQLERDIDIPKKRIHWFKYFFQIALPAFLFSMRSSAQVGKIRVTTTKDTTQKPVCNKPMLGEVYFPEKITRLDGHIQLQVVNEKGEAIPYASIVTDVIGKGGAANKDGEFDLDKSTLNINGHVFVSSAGYERKEIAVKTLSAVTGSFTIQLQTKTWMPVVVISGYSIKGRYMRVSTTKVQKDSSAIINKTGEKDIVAGNEINNAKFLVYPNPVSRSGIVHASCKNFAEGNYHFEVLNLAGQVIRKSELLIDKKTFLFDVPVPPSSAAGTYFIVLIDKVSGKKYTEKVIIQ